MLFPCVSYPLALTGTVIVFIVTAAHAASVHRTQPPNVSIEPGQDRRPVSFEKVELYRRMVNPFLGVQRSKSLLNAGGSRIEEPPRVIDQLNDQTRVAQFRQEPLVAPDGSPTKSLPARETVEEKEGRLRKYTTKYRIRISKLPDKERPRSKQADYIREYNSKSYRRLQEARGLKVQDYKPRPRYKARLRSNKIVGPSGEESLAEERVHASAPHNNTPAAASGSVEPSAGTAPRTTFTSVSPVVIPAEHAPAGSTTDVAWFHEILEENPHFFDVLPLK